MHEQSLSPATTGEAIPLAVAGREERHLANFAAKLQLIEDRVRSVALKDQTASYIVPWWDQPSPSGFWKNGKLELRSGFQDSSFPQSRTPGLEASPRHPSWRVLASCKSTSWICPAASPCRPRSSCGLPRTNVTTPVHFRRQD